MDRNAFFNMLYCSWTWLFLFSRFIPSECCSLYRESTRLAENGRPRVSLLLPLTGSDTARGERTAACLPVVACNGERHGSRRTDGRVSLLLPVTGSSRRQWPLSLCTSKIFPETLSDNKGAPGYPSPWKSTWDRICGDLTTFLGNLSGTWARQGKNSDR